MNWFTVFALIWPLASILLVAAVAVLLNVYGEKFERGLRRQQPAE